MWKLWIHLEYRWWVLRSQHWTKAVVLALSCTLLEGTCCAAAPEVRSFSGDWFLLGTLYYRNLALLFQWLLKLSHAGVGLDVHFGSYQAKAFEATLWVEPCYHLIHVTQQARSELDSFCMKQNWKMCPRSLPNALQLLMGTRSVGQPDREPSKRGTAWCQVLSTALSLLHQVPRSRTAGSGKHCLPFNARCRWAASGCFT